MIVPERKVPLSVSVDRGVLKGIKDAAAGSNRSVSAVVAEELGRAGFGPPPEGKRGMYALSLPYQSDEKFPGDWYKGADELLVIGRLSDTLLSRSRNTLHRLVDGGCSLRFLLPDPKGGVLRFLTENRFELPYASVQIEGSLGSIYELKARAGTLVQGDADRVLVRIYNDVVPFSGILRKKKDESGKMQPTGLWMDVPPVSLYLETDKIRTTGQPPLRTCLVFSPRHCPVFKELTDTLESLWISSTPNLGNLTP